MTWEKQFDAAYKNILIRDSGSANYSGIKQFISDLLIETKRETLDLIADGEGWEESRDVYAEKLGLEIKYPDLFERYKKCSFL